jgi:hypothetical protein
MPRERLSYPDPGFRSNGSRFYENPVQLVKSKNSNVGVTIVLRPGYDVSRCDWRLFSANLRSFRKYYFALVEPRKQAMNGRNTRVLVRLDHVARVIVNANHRIM